MLVTKIVELIQIRVRLFFLLIEIFKNNFILNLNIILINL